MFPLNIVMQTFNTARHPRHLEAVVNVLTVVLLNPDILCLCKQCRSRSVGFWRSQQIWICTVCHSVYEFLSTMWIKGSDWLKIRRGWGILIYSAWQGLSTCVYAALLSWIILALLAPLSVTKHLPFHFILNPGHVEYELVLMVWKFSQPKGDLNPHFSLTSWEH